MAPAFPRRFRHLQRPGSRFAAPFAAVLLAVVVALAAAPPAAAQRVGEVVLARGEVLGTPAGGSEAAMVPGDPFALGHRIATGDDSEALLTFDPRGSLRLYAETRVTVDRALVDSAGRSDSKLSLLVGRLRLALGSLFRGDLDIDTPTATVGIKGTELLMAVGGDGTTLVALLEGRVTVTAKAGGELTLEVGQFTIVRPGQRPTAPAPLDRGDGDIEAAAMDLAGLPADLHDVPPFMTEQGLPPFPFPPDRGQRQPTGPDNQRPPSTNKPPQ